MGVQRCHLLLLLFNNQVFRSLLETHFRGDVQSFVGTDEKGWMTKQRFVGLVSKRSVRLDGGRGGERGAQIHNTCCQGSSPPRLGLSLSFPHALSPHCTTQTQHTQLANKLLQPVPGQPNNFYALYVLYYAGHGDKPDGHFCLERKETANLDDILDVWAASAPYKAGASKLLVVADSCFSGHMVARLRALCAQAQQAQRTRHALAALESVAVQSTAKKYAYGETFVPSYLDHLEAQGQRLMRRQVYLGAGHPDPGRSEIRQEAEFYAHWVKGGAGGRIATGPARGDRPFPLFKGST